MDWNSLLSAIVGGLLTVIPVLITIRNQTKERDKDRQEQREDARIQLALELMRNDISVIEEVINNDMKSMDIYTYLRFKKEAGKITEAEMREQMKAITLDENNKYNLMTEAYPIAVKLAYSLGDEFYKEFRDYQDASLEQLKYYVNSPTFAVEDMERVDSEVYKCAAKLHNMLKDRLISVRE